MKRVIIYLLFSCCSAMAVEYGYFARNDGADAWSKESVILNENDIFILMHNNADDPDQTRTYFLIDMPNIVQRGIDLRTGRSGIIYPEDYRTICGPCTITPGTQTFNGTIIFYKIIRAAESAAPSDSQYSASLNADGTRLAIGEQQGTNTSSRVYEYNDLTGAWEQLGDSVE